MNIHNLTELSIYIITEYYKGNLQPYFENIDDDILWIGPAKGQFLCGKKAILDTWAKEKHELTFSMSNITSSYISSNGSYTEIILSYELLVRYPNNLTVHRDQILHYTWCKRKISSENGGVQKVPRILMIHISNSMSYDIRDSIYPVHLKAHESDLATPFPNKTRILVNGKNRYTYSLLTDQIQWIESSDKGQHSIIHLTDKQIPSLTPISVLADQYSHHFIRIHASYLITPLYVYSIQRFQLILLDQTALPIPQKKYTEVKQAIEDWIRNSK